MIAKNKIFIVSMFAVFIVLFHSHGVARETCPEICPDGTRAYYCVCPTGDKPTTVERSRPPEETTNKGCNQSRAPGGGAEQGGCPQETYKQPGDTKPSPTNDDEQMVWDAAKEANTANGYEIYLKTYPNGRYVTVAKIKMDAVKKDSKETVSKKHSLTIHTQPVNAKVSILNIKPSYRDGIELEPGSYHISVSKSGYEAEDRWVEINNSDVVMEVALDRSTSAAASNTIQGQTIVGENKQIQNQQNADPIQIINAFGNVMKGLQQKR